MKKNYFALQTQQYKLSSKQARQKAFVEKHFETQRLIDSKHRH